MSGARIDTLVTMVIILLALVVRFCLLRPASTESSGGEQVQAETVAVAIKEGSMPPWQVTVYEGDKVNLQITSARSLSPRPPKEAR